MKRKLNPDQVAMIIADWQHGEFTTCQGFECENCALNEELPISFVDNNKVTLCNVMVQMSEVLNEVKI